MDDTARMGETENMIWDMNQCWTAGWHEEQFRQYIHPHAVAIVPTNPGWLEGRDAYRAGWRSFTQAVVIHEWRETYHKVQIYTGGKSVVVTYVFSITFTRGRGRQTMQGRDMVFLVKEGGRGLVAADQCSPNPQQTVSAGS